MNLKNSALQDLYDTIVESTTLALYPYRKSQIDKAFRECDDELSESITFAAIKDLQDRNDILNKSELNLLEANMELASKKRQLEKEIENLKKQNENLASQYQKLTIENKRLQDANTTLEKANDDRTNLQEACDKLSGENRRLNARIYCLRLEVNWYRKHYKEQSDKIGELTKNYQDLSIKLKRYQIDVGRESRYLWDMLQKVNDAKPFELATCFPDVTCMDDILSWDLEDFLDAYKSWQEKKDQERTKYFETWTYTLEETINAEINKDLLNKVCGIDSDD